MEMKLVVLAGAKHGTEIPLKKDQFTIGRATDCTLRAGSEAISRRHCLIQRTGDGWQVRDMGSRNGTFVNDEQLAEPHLLVEGDHLRVGPLEFRVEAWQRKSAAKPVAAADLKKEKKPPVKNVVDVAARTARIDDENGSAGQGGEFEDDISRWLIGTDVGEKSMQETINFKADETRAMKPTTPDGAAENRPGDSEEADSEEADSEEADRDESDSEEADGDAIDETELPASEATKSGSWTGLFSRGKKKESKKKESSKRQKPGKLPQRPDKNQAKDSREAAADILREMTRRR